ncbi:complement C4-like [Rhinoraja longicauda]
MVKGNDVQREATVSFPDGTPAVSVPVMVEEGPVLLTDQRGLAVIETDTPANTSSFSLEVIAGEGSVAREGHVTADIYRSPSQSYLHIRAPHTPVKMGQSLDIELRAHTQGDGGTINHIYYLVTSKGRILSAERVARGDPTRLRLLVVPDMVPTFRLLAYYYTGKAEIVANSVWIDVEDKCRGRVEMKDLDEVYKPGSEFDLHFSTNDGANVSFVAVDSAMYILNNKNRLTPRKMFEAMNSYDLGCSYGGGAKSSEVFMDAGLSFLSDVDVSGFRQDDTCKKGIERQRRGIPLDDEFSSILSGQRGGRLRKCCLDGAAKILMPLDCRQRAQRVADSWCREVFMACCEHKMGKRRNQTKVELGRSRVDTAVVVLDKQIFDESSVHVRSHFPQSWLWETFAAGQAGDHRITSNIPDSITTWEIQAVGMFENKGFCVEEPKKMKVFRPFFLAMNLPYSVRRHEQVIVKVTLYNYLQQSVKVAVYMKDAEGLCSSLGSRENAATLEVPGKAARSIDLTLVPLAVGSLPVHVFAFRHGGGHTDALLKHLRVLYEGKVEQKESSIVLNAKVKRSIEILERPPTNVIPDARNYLYVKPTASILGNAVENALTPAGIDKLITEPMGCAEQTAMHMAPTVFAVEYLDQTEQWISLAAERKDEALSLIEKGYTRILVFKKDDGSYGAWKTRPSSTWLTAFIVKIFCIVKRHVAVNEKLVFQSVSYLIRAQRDDGHFDDPHPLLMKAMQGGVGGTESQVTLTAFVTVALQHFLNTFLQPNSPNIAKLRESIGKAVGFLGQELPNIRQPYTVAISAYALQEDSLGLPSPVASAFSGTTVTLSHPSSDVSLEEEWLFGAAAVSGSETEGAGIGRKRAAIPDSDSEDDGGGRWDVPGMLDIGAEIDRWRLVKGYLKVRSDEEVAKTLLDLYLKTHASPPQPRTPIPVCVMKL